MFDYLKQYNQIKHEIISEIEKVLESGQLILGDNVKLFESKFSNFLGAQGKSVGVNSGTDALVVALMACGVGRGGEVITTSNTAVPTVSAIRMVGATPVFCDVDESTALMDLEQVQICLSIKTKAIIPVHLFGNVVDINYLKNIILGKDIAIIEDCAQAHGASLNGEMAGTLGDASAFSFYPTKNLGAFGDAGLCYSTNQHLYNKMRKIRMYGFNNEPYAEIEGINSRMDEVQAAILNVKLPYLESSIKQRRSLADYYNKLLDPRIERFSVKTGVKHAYHLFVIRLHNRDYIKHTLAEQGILTGIHYPCPIHLMRGYKFLGYKQGDLPVTESLSTELLSLPIYPGLSKNSVKQVCDALNSIFNIR